MKSKQPFTKMMSAALRLVQGRDVQAATRAVQHAVRGVLRASTKAAKRQGDIIDVIMRERPEPRALAIAASSRIVAHAFAEAVFQTVFQAVIEFDRADSPRGPSPDSG